MVSALLDILLLPVRLIVPLAILLGCEIFIVVITNLYLFSKV
jgi:hypothetical protein